MKNIVVEIAGVSNGFVITEVQPHYGVISTQVAKSQEEAMDLAWALFAEEPLDEQERVF